MFTNESQCTKSKPCGGQSTDYLVFAEILSWYRNFLFLSAAAQRTCMQIWSVVGGGENKGETG